MSADVHAIVAEQRARKRAEQRAEHARNVERMAAASPTIARERQVERILTSVFGHKS